MISCKSHWVSGLVAVCSVCNLAIAQSHNTPTVYVVGDSTAANGADGARGWGRHLSKFFDAERVRIENRARGGRSSRTYVTEGLWREMESGIQPGDVVLIQFGHNDGGKINDTRRARGSLPGLDDETTEIENQQTNAHEVVHTFGWYMRKMIAEARGRGAIPIVLSLTVRNIWDGDHVERGSGRYSEWARELAKSEEVAFIDLTKLIADEYEELGAESVATYFPRDHTHTSDEGALLNAKLVVKGFKGLREEMWSPWLSVEGRQVPRAAPKYVQIPSVRRGGTAESQNRFLNTPQPADTSLPTIWLIGDSTVRTGRGRGEQGQFGWGDPLQDHFDLTKVNVVNRAMGGAGARTFRSGGFWRPVVEKIQPGDVVLMQFGHNDNGPRGALPGVGQETQKRAREDNTTETVETFGAYLRKFVHEIRQRQATPIICSLIPRKIWQDGAIRRSNDGHASWARQVAEEEGVLFVDLHERVAQRYDAMGAEAVEPMFADRGVHTSYSGAALNARCVLEGLNSLSDNPLQAYLLEENASE